MSALFDDDSIEASVPPLPPIIQPATEGDNVNGLARAAMLVHTSFDSERAGGYSNLPLLPSPELGIQMNDPASDQNENSSDVSGGDDTNDNSSYASVEDNAAELQEPQLSPTMYVPQPNPLPSPLPSPTTTSKPTISQALNDQNYYLDHEPFFQDLQDDGICFPPKYVELLKKKPNRNWSRHYRHGDLLYPSIWLVSRRFYDEVITPNFDNSFSKVNKQSTKPVQEIAAWIFANRFSRGIDDLASESNDSNSQLKYLRLSKYAELEHVYFLDQRQLLQHCLEKWGQSMDDLMRTTEDDRLRALGILFLEDMCEYIPYFLSSRDPQTAHSGDRSHIDSWTGKRKLAANLLFDRFIDSEVNITFPKEWTSDAARLMIDTRHCEEGIYDGLKYNPNNPERMKLPWKNNEVFLMVTSTLIQYKAVMELYKSGTGGGSGDPVAYSVWQNRDSLQSVTYNQSRSKIYLSIVHIWDKSKNWPLTYSKGIVPLSVAIDDNLDSASASIGTPLTATKYKNDHQTFIEKLEARMESREVGFNKATTDVISSIQSFGKSAEDEMSQTDKQIQLQRAIESTNEQLQSFENQRQDLKQKKRMIPKDAKSPTKKRKRRKIAEDMKIKDELIAQYNTTLRIHMKNLRTVNGDTNIGDDDSNTSDSDSD